MPAVKLNISLEATVAEMLRIRAKEAGQPISRYLSELILADARRTQDELAAEGYRILSSDTAQFAAAAEAIVLETWPEWNETAQRVREAGATM